MQDAIDTITEPLFYQELALAIGIIVAFALAGQILLFFLSNTVFRFTRRTRSQVDDIVLNAIRGPIVWGLTLLGIGTAYEVQSQLLPADWDAVMGHILFIGYSLIAFVLLYRLIGNMIDWYMHEKASATETTLDDQLLPFMRRLLISVLLIAIVILILQDLGQPVGSLIATLGVGSLAFALAAQSTLSDIIAGFLILIDRRYRIGDRIELIDQDIIGDVDDIGLRTTRLLTMDYRMVIVPNSMIASNMVINHAYPDPNLRVDLPIGVAYGSDIRQVKAVLLSAIRRLEKVHQARQPDIVITDFGDNAVNLELRVWIDAYADKPKMIDRINEAAYIALNEAGVEIPFPQRTLWHRVERHAVPYVHAAFTSDGVLPASVEANGVPGERQSASDGTIEAATS